MCLSLVQRTEVSQAASKTVHVFTAPSHVTISKLYSIVDLASSSISGRETPRRVSAQILTPLLSLKRL